MKKNLFLLVVGLLTSLTISAGEWTQPTQEFQKTSTIASDVEYYLYNVDADAWFAGGNNWWTAAVVYKTGDANLSAEGMEHGFKFKFTDKQENGSYHFYHFYGPNGKLSSVNNKWWSLYDRNDGVFFTDNSSGDTYWTFEFAVDGTVKFKSSKAAYGANYVGLATQDGTTPYFTEDDGKTSRTGESDKTGGATMTNNNPVCTTWQLYAYGDPAANAEWAAYETLTDRLNTIYEESEATYGEAFQVSVYMNQIGEQVGTLAHAEELTKLLATANSDYKEWQYAKASPDTPADVTTKYITNPDFETGNTDGWTYEKSNDHGAKSTTNDTYKMSGSSGKYLFNIWSAGNPISQTVEGVPAGVYKLMAVMGTDAGKTFNLTFGDKVVSAASVDKGTGVEIEACAALTGEDVKIQAVTADNYWYKVDNFRLYYLGTSGASYAAIFSETYADKASYCYQKGLAELVATLKAAEGDAIQTAYNAAKEYEEGTVAENVAAWEQYNKLKADATELVNNPDYADYAAELSAKLQIAYAITNTDEDPTTEALNEDYESILKSYNELKSHVKPGTDVTSVYLKNADFTKDLVSDPTQGWVVTGTKTSGCNWRISTGDKCGECWNGKDFDFYQVVSDAPTGVYEIQVQGFTRANRGATSWGYYFDAKTGERLETPVFSGWTPNKANVYLNDNTGDLAISYDYGHLKTDNFYGSATDVYDDPLGINQYPDGMVSAGIAFAAEEYKVSAFGLVQEGETMRIGVKGNNYGADNWTIFTNFKLIYQGFDADVILPQFQKAVESLSSAHIGTELQEELVALQAEAAGISTTDGKAMFDMLAKIYAFNSKKASSEETFASLLSNIKDLEDAYTQYKLTATAEALDNAQALQATATDAYENEDTGMPTVTTEKAQEIIEQFPAVIDALKVPKSSGSDDDPVDFTSVIKTPNMISAEGWTVAQGNMTADGANKIAEFFNQENYNVYQKIYGLPEGLYEISVQGFYRAGSFENDYSAVASATESNAMMYVYNDCKSFGEEWTEEDSTKLECPIRHNTAEALNEDPSIDGFTSFQPFAEKLDNTKWYMPNNLASTSTFVNSAAENYLNSVYVYVWGPADTITIGIKKQGPVVDTDWTAFTNWKMTGYGNESVKKEGVNTSSYADSTIVFNEKRADARFWLNKVIKQGNDFAATLEEGDTKETLVAAIAEAQTVFDNADATQEEIESAADALVQAIEDAGGTVGISAVKANAATLADGKYFKDGKIIIVKNGKQYNATGAQIK